MKTEARFHKQSHDRVRISVARRYIRAHAADGVSLADIAAEAGASPFHFSRLFSALAGETVFDYVTRVRLHRATAMLAGNARLPVTEVALAVGYQTPSAFNRVFRAVLGVSPTCFRTASPKQRRRLLALLEDPRRRSNVNLDMPKEPEFRERPERPYLHVSRVGVCAEEAPRAWEELNRILAAARPALGAETEFIGASREINELPGERDYRYDAGITAVQGAHLPSLRSLPGLTLGTLPGGRYAVFRYRGSFRFIWNAVDQAFRGWGARGGVIFRQGPLLEIYLNDPRVTPEADLLTDLCFPVA